MAAARDFRMFFFADSIRGTTLSNCRVMWYQEGRSLEVHESDVKARRIFDLGGVAY
jgi:hypothetical protein